MDGTKLTRHSSLVGFGGFLLGLLGWRAATSEGAGPAAVASGAVSANDFVFAQGGRRSLLAPRKVGSAYVGSITMGVNR